MRGGLLLLEVECRSVCRIPEAAPLDDCEALQVLDAESLGLLGQALLLAFLVPCHALCCGHGNRSSSDLLCRGINLRVDVDGWSLLPRAPWRCTYTCPGCDARHLGGGEACPLGFDGDLEKSCGCCRHSRGQVGGQQARGKQLQVEFEWIGCTVERSFHNQRLWLL